MGPLYKEFLLSMFSEQSRQAKKHIASLFYTKKPDTIAAEMTSLSQYVIKKAIIKGTYSRLPIPQFNSSNFTTHPTCVPHYDDTDTVFRPQTLAWVQG